MAPPLPPYSRRLQSCHPWRRPHYRLRTLSQHHRALLPSFGADPSVNHVDGLLQDLADRGVHELSLCFSLSFSHRRESIPASLFACASLTRLCLICAIFPEVAADNAAAPLSLLKELDLFDVTISDDALNSCWLSARRWSPSRRGP